MTTFDVSRRTLLKGSGSIVVGFALAEALGLPAEAAPTSRGELKDQPPCAAGFRRRRLPDHDRVRHDHLQRASGAGTGVQTALTQIVVEELRLGMKKVDFVQGDTELNRGRRHSRQQVHPAGRAAPRRAAATAYQALLARAAIYLKAPASSLTATKGEFAVNGTAKSVTYEKLLTGPNVLLTAAANPPPSSHRPTTRSSGRPFPASTSPARRWPRSIRVRLRSAGHAARPGRSGPAAGTLRSRRSRPRPSPWRRPSRASWRTSSKATLSESSPRRSTPPSWLRLPRRAWWSSGRLVRPCLRWQPSSSRAHGYPGQSLRTFIDKNNKPTAG